MGFPWYNENTDDHIDWEVVGRSFDKYFAKLGSEGCCLLLDGEVWVVDIDNIKVGDGDGHYYRE